ncbi:MAG: hypothetical protein V1725_04610 [archaeon]
MKSLVLLIMITLLSTAVFADVIMPNQKSVSYCFTIDNMAEYPDYVFIMVDDTGLGVGAGGSPYVIPQGECVRFYKFRTPSVFAMPTAAYNEELTGALQSGLLLQYTSATNKDDPLKSRQDILHIDSLSADSFVLSKKSVLYTYEDGSTETLPYTTDMPPTPTKSAWHAGIWYAVPVLAAIGIILVLLLRKKK